MKYVKKAGNTVVPEKSSLRCSISKQILRLPMRLTHISVLVYLDMHCIHFKQNPCDFFSSIDFKLLFKIGHISQPYKALGIIIELELSVQDIRFSIDINYKVN